MKAVLQDIDFYKLFISLFLLFAGAGTFLFVLDWIRRKRDSRKHKIQGRECNEV